jgi:short subunit dehydrogenase-like uncharacterized protein
VPRIGPAETWLIYGANGYTGRLIAKEAVHRGLRPVLAGRDGHAVAAVADPLGLSMRTFSLNEPAVIAEALEGIGAVIHCAGPFQTTAAPMLEGCLRVGAHYIDVTGEIDVLEHVLDRDPDCRQAGIVALPGAGFDVVPSDCLVAMLKQDLPGASSLDLVIGWTGGTVSPGTLRSSLLAVRDGGRARRDGRIVRAPLARPTRIVGPDGRKRTLLIIPWGDVSTAYRSTGIANVATYLEADHVHIIGAASLLLRAILRLPGAERFATRMARRLAGADVGEEDENETATLWAVATDPGGRRISRHMRTPGRYSVTVDAALACLRGVQARTPESGAHTPSRAFGADFALSLRGVECEVTSV